MRLSHWNQSSLKLIIWVLRRNKYQYILTPLGTSEIFGSQDTTVTFTVWGAVEAQEPFATKTLKERKGNVSDR